MTKTTQGWQRPGVRVNLYFPSRDDLRRIDKKARAARLTRSAYLLMLATKAA